MLDIEIDAATDATSANVRTTEKFEKHIPVCSNCGTASERVIVRPG
ncbi:MAG: hypothetical protein LBP28_07935 [Coriobacteriales bacterium]|jgi:hypothetical protein|nr:hypothetical protein [Coriobacteriales bacterium]